MTVYAYMRVSTDNKGQTTDNQKQQILAGGFAVDHWISEDGVSGSKKALDRPAFGKMFSKLSEGDVVIVTMIDRLGRSAHDILSVVEEFKTKNIRLRVMQFDGIDITSSTGKMILTCMAAMAELERNILIERTKAGLERTKAQGTRLGAPLTIEPKKLDEIVTFKLAGVTYDKLAMQFGIPRNTIARNVAKWGDKLDEYKLEWEKQHVKAA